MRDMSVDVLRMMLLFLRDMNFEAATLQRSKAAYELL
jgi:hypothetical protein